VKDLYEAGATLLVSTTAAKLCTVYVRVECPRKSFTTECVVVML
jgi:hypothetical protein